jgi:hypothetical protein
MSSYADFADFQAKFPRYEVTGDTAPSVSDVEAQLENYSAELDGVLAQRGYDLPISETASLAFLRAICLVGTGWWYVRTCFPNATGGIVDELRREWEWFLTALATGQAELPGTDLFPSAEVESYMAAADADDIEAAKPFITRKQQF